LKVALISARVKSIENEITAKDSDDDDPNAPLEDDSLSTSTSTNLSTPQTVAQLEVLYESEITLPKLDSEGNSDGSEVTKIVVTVATFEACIDGDPNGDKMRWRLCGERPAMEFGYHVGMGLSGR
jgi:hypothetical protein